MTRRVFLAALFHETHGFVDDTTPREAFRQRRGAEVLARAGDGSPVDGFLEVARAEGWQVVAGPDWAAMPSGPVEHGAFVEYLALLRADLAAALKAGPLDGVFLVLHGAMTTTEEEDAEGALLAALRAVPGAEALPVAAVFDLHATFTEAMARGADALLCYRRNPHVDARESAMRAARLLAAGFRARPRMSWRRVKVIWPPTGTGTEDSPMAELEAAARAMEARFPKSVLGVNVVAGFAYADAREAGVSVSAVLRREDAAAERALDELAAMAVALADRGHPREHDLDAVLAALPAEGPQLLVEPADNIGGGAPGDCTPVLRGLLRHGIEGAAVVMNDPAAVRALREVEIGGAMMLEIGGRGWSRDEGPVGLEARLVSRSDGVFRLHDRGSHLASMVGERVEMGDCAVVRSGGVTILLTSRKTPPMDLGQWYSQALDPARFRAIGVKAAVAHRRAYDPIARGSFTVATAGPCGSDLRGVAYRRLEAERRAYVASLPERSS